MDRTQFKQRIVGAIVLVALGVIFIPIILNQEGEDSPISGSNIPEKPDVLKELATQQPPVPPAGPDVDTSKPRLVDEHTPPVEQTDTAATDKKSETPKKTESAKKPSEIKSEQTTPTTTDKAQTPAAQTKPTKPTSTTAGKTRAWVVQVASFSERNKALKLRDRLRKAKYSAFVESASSAKGTRYRVRVGPVVQRSKADALKTKISKEFKIKDTLVMSHP